MPTAEAVIVPILDEFKLIRTRVGEFIIGAGVLDDVIEVFLVALVSVWIGEKAGDVGGGITGLIMGVLAFILLAWLCYRWVIVCMGRWLPRRPRNLMLLSMVILFGFGGLSEYTSLGMVVGAITAGVLMRPAFDRMGVVGEQVTQNHTIGQLWLFRTSLFFWVGLNADLEGLFREPALAILLYLAGTVGKLVGVFLMVPMKKITVREAWTIDPFEPKAMKRKPRCRREKIQSGLGNFLIGYPLLMTIVAIGLFMVEFNRTGHVESARTWVFLSIIFFELYQAFASRSTLFPSIKVGLFKNRALLGAILLSFIVALCAVYLPKMNHLFGTSPLTILELLIVLILSSVGFIYLEISKHLRSKRLALTAD